VAAKGRVSFLVIMYAINVFLTFSLTTAGMFRHWLQARRAERGWIRQALIQFTALILCLSILTVTILEKFTEGAWLTLLVTTAVIALCVAIRQHYMATARTLKELDRLKEDLPAADVPGGEPVSGEPTAVLLVGGFGGLGVHSFFSIERLFPQFFKNIFFVGVGTIDSGSFKGASEIDRLEKTIKGDLEKYVALARKMGWNASFRMASHVDPVDELTKLCMDIAFDYPQAMFFAGKLLWKRETWYQRILHNATAYQVERRLQWKGLPMTVLPIRIITNEPPTPVRKRPSPQAPASRPT
jgi:hypothetical protein